MHYLRKITAVEAGNVYDMGLERSEVVARTQVVSFSVKLVKNTEAIKKRAETMAAKSKDAEFDLQYYLKSLNDEADYILSKFKAQNLSLTRDGDRVKVDWGDSFFKDKLIEIVLMDEEGKVIPSLEHLHAWRVEGEVLDVKDPVYRLVR